MLTDEVTNENFADIIEQNFLVCLDFWANFCEPCKQFLPTYENLALKYPTILFAKIDIEQQSALSESLEIRSIPHLMIFKQGILIYSAAGAMASSMLEDLLQQALAVNVDDISQSLLKSDQSKL